MGAQLTFLRLSVTAPGRTYDVHLKSGVNLITGPISTGKSSILQLINFACGSQTRPSYPEISKCSDVLVECTAGSERLTIRRSLSGPGSKVWLYEGSVDDVLNQRVVGNEVNARHQPDAASVSSELMKRLDLGNIEVKTAPTQDASDTVAFSFRDLLLLMNVTQDRMGAAKAFFESEPFKRIKWHAGFEIVHGFYDQTTAALAASLKEAETEEHRLRLHLEGVRRFLDDFRIPTIERLEVGIADIERDELATTAKLREHKQKISEGLGGSRELTQRKRDQDTKVQTLKARAGELTRSVEQLGRLRVQYDRERSQLEFLEESKRLIGSLPVIRCPSCLQLIDRKPSGTLCHVCAQDLPVAAEEVSVGARLRAMKRRITDLEGYVTELEETRQGLARDLEAAERELGEIDQALRRLEGAELLPNTQVLLEINESLGLIASRKKQAKEHLSLRQKARGDGSNLLALQEQITRLRDEQERSLAAKKSSSDAVDAVSTLFSELLAEIKFPDQRDSRIDPKTYDPIVRNQNYAALSSRGAIALAVTCWHLAILKRSIEEDTLFPRFLMLDSPLSHVGHDSADAQFKDQQIVEAFFSALLTLHQNHADKFQILICDNRPPALAAGMIAVEFTRDPTRGRFGLIEDEKSAPEPSSRTDSSEA